MVRRYAGDEARAIVVVGGHEAERRWLPARRRPRDADAVVPGVDVTRMTVIDTQPAEPVMPEDPEAAVEPALVLVNRTLAGHRVASADPFVAEVRRESALAVRVGYGDGEEVAHGHWTEAVEVPHPKPARSTLAPQERLAAILSARDVVLTCEQLALRAEADLATGRLREAALELRSALDVAVAELQAFAELSGMADRIAELEALRDEVHPIAEAAIAGGIDAECSEPLTRAHGRLTAALRARLAATGL